MSSTLEAPPRRRRLKRLAVLIPLVTLVLVAIGVPAFGADKPIYDGGGLVPKTVTDVAVSLNLLWVVIGAVLVIFMQAGFALVETGLQLAGHGHGQASR